MCTLISVVKCNKRRKESLLGLDGLSKFPLHGFP